MEPRRRDSLLRNLNRENVSKSGIRKPTSHSTRHSRHTSNASPRPRTSATTRPFKVPPAQKHPRQHSPAPLPASEEQPFEDNDGMDISPKKQASSSTPSPTVSKRRRPREHAVATQEECHSLEVLDTAHYDDMEVDSPAPSAQQRKRPAQSPARSPIAREHRRLDSHSPAQDSSNGYASTSQYPGPTPSQIVRNNPPVLGMRRKNFTPYTTTQKSEKPSPPGTSSGPSQSLPSTSSTQVASSSSASSVSHARDSSRSPKKSQTLPSTSRAPRTPRKVKSQITFVHDPLSPSRRPVPGSPSRKEKRPGGPQSDSSRKPIIMSTSRGGSPFVDFSTIGKGRAKGHTERRPPVVASKPVFTRAARTTALCQRKASSLPPEPEEQSHSSPSPGSDDVDISFSYDMDELEDVLKGLDE